MGLSRLQHAAMGYDLVRQAFDDQARACRAMGAPFSARVIDAVAKRLGDGGPFDPLVGSWLDAGVEEIGADAVSLRVLAGFHNLVLADSAPALAAHYPGHGDEADPAALAVRLDEVAAAHGKALTRFMASPPQTNEAGRSFCLLGGFLTVAAQTGLPLRCLELGASAGLNQIWDRFHYAVGAHGTWGDPASPVRLDGVWTGGAPPLDAAVRIAARKACDQAPIDLADPVAARRLVAYVWAEQAARLQRVKAAVALARAEGVTVDRADAGEWAERHAVPAAGAATVLYHSVFWQYPPAATRERIARAIATAGAAATAAAPFAWLRMEPFADTAAETGFAFDVRLTQWPEGEERRLAVVHPHGAWVRWA